MSIPSIPSGNMQAKYDYYCNLVKANQGILQPGVDTVLGMRGLGLDGVRHDSNENIGPYNDTFVILHDNTVQEFTGSTHAGQKSSTESPQGVAQLRPGTFEAIPHGDHDGLPSWQVLNLDGQDGLPAWRDINKDGYISPQEKSVAEAQGSTATEILFHNGRFEDHGSSIGCQVFPPKTMQAFIDDMDVTKSFHYTLIDANQPTPGSLTDDDIQS